MRFKEEWKNKVMEDFEKFDNGEFPCECCGKIFKKHTDDEAFECAMKLLEKGKEKT